MLFRSIFGKDGGKRMAESMGIPFLGQIPIVQSIREGGDIGSPVALDPESISGKAFKKVANLLVESIEKRNHDVAPTQKINVTRK